eukprot:CAMPEP_0194551034 /NCGR_PEP_ID=MMETSP0253-20130528/96015_1 /TAXON_ID=2966 /ORGANISM="Noctiluca scintillans" /LENGTH=106 /DNA_ID=CAMNT_0039398485 /DNA_START=51 /DNA_END=371 /DNA_ORIENTATION=+
MAADGDAFPSQYDASGLTSFESEDKALRGEDLQLVCRLADGQVIEFLCPRGQDVTYAKAHVARKLDLPYGSLKLFLDGKLMFDPLSFFDFPTIDPKQKVNIDVLLS